jgi:uncharacterized protein YndB with AHSA1/START domain
MTDASRQRVDSASRIIRASPQAIYDAFIDPDALVSWLPPNGAIGHIQVFDPREGGAFRMTLVFGNAHGAGKTSDNTDEVAGRFVRLKPAELIVQDIEFVSDDPVFAGTMMMTWKLDQVADGTAVTITCENVPSGISPEDHAAGLASTLANLASWIE